jgi:hypothetical protein
MDLHEMEIDLHEIAVCVCMTRRLGLHGFVKRGFVDVRVQHFLSLEYTWMYDVRRLRDPSVGKPGRVA